MSSPIALFTDDFTDNVVAPAWSASNTTASASFAETGGQARLTLPASTAGSHLAYYRTGGTYDLTGGSFYWNIQTMVSTAVAAEAAFDLYLDTANVLRWRQLSNVITARTIVAGVETQQYTAAWSSSTYKYLRIRELSGNVLWDSSTNGTTWTNRVSIAAPFAVTSLYVQFTASCGNVATPGSLRLDDVNLILPAPSSTWRETTADWSIVNRLRSVTLASDGGKQGAIVTADTMDETTRALGGTLRYFAGPLGSSSGGFLQMTEYASLALAQASAFTLPVNGRVDLPSQVDARYMRLYHRSTDASAHTIYEYFPRRLVQADDIEAESIVALNISAGAITADKIFAHTITAVQIGTVDLDATARITAGGGVVTLDDQGMKILAPPFAGGYSALASIDFVTDTGTRTSSVYGTYTAGVAQALFLESLATGSGYQAQVTTQAAPPSGSGLLSSGITMLSEKTGTISSMSLFAQSFLFSNGGLRVGSSAPAGAANGEIVTTGKVTVGAGLNVGGATAATAGQVIAQVSDAGTATFPIVVQLDHMSSGTPAANFGTMLAFSAKSSTTASQMQGDILGLWVVPTHASRTAVLAFRGYDSVGGREFLRGGANGSAATLSFYGATAIVKPAVTGAKAGNVALTNLMVALANLGLLTDSTT